MTAEEYKQELIKELELERDNLDTKFRKLRDVETLGKLVEIRKIIDIVRGKEQ